MLFLKHMPYHSVQFNHSVMSESLRPHGLQYARLPWTSSSWSLLKFMSIELVMPSNCLIFCHPLLLPPSIFPASGSFPVSQFFASGGQSIGDSDSASVLPMNTQGWCPLGWTGWISLQSKGLSRVFSSSTIRILCCSVFFMVQLSHPYMTTGKTIALTRWTFVNKVMSLLFNMWSMFSQLFFQGASVF